jgi:hypothetical protein
MTQALIDSKITVFAQNPHFMIPVEVSTLVDIKMFNDSNVNHREMPKCIGVKK